MLSIVALLEKKSKFQKIENLNDLRVMFAGRPLLALSVSILFLSLMGFPPFLGFWSRFYICSFLMNRGFSAAIFVATFIPSLICTAKILVAIWFGKNERSSALENSSARMIYFMTCMTLLAIPFAHRLSEQVKMEQYFGR
jgi:NADH:ubiquinone oxidoreductase subunit 2 (subunit N)